MNSKTLEDLLRVSFIVLTVWTVNGILIFFLLTRLDALINVQLYNFGLQFNSQWADPYWSSMGLLMIFTALPMILSVVVFALGLVVLRKKPLAFFSRRKSVSLPVQEEKEEEEKNEGVIPVTVESEPIEPEIEPEPIEEPQNEDIGVIQPELIKVEVCRSEAEAGKTDIIEEPKAKEKVGLVISCPSCGKVFSRPLVMLDFNKGTTRLVNVCPFCNQILGEAIESKKNGEKPKA
jgi:hypothetical protein